MLKVLYYSIWSTPMQVILDTGCRTAVAGAIWHRNFQEKLNQRQLPYFPVKRQETFRFGAGEPVISTTAYAYPHSLAPVGVCATQPPTVGWSGVQP